MKSIKVRKILENSDKLSLRKNYDFSESCFSYSEVLDLIKMSNEELSKSNSNLPLCEELMKYLESKIRVIDLPKAFYSDEISMLIEISELFETENVNEKIAEFKNIF